jgi:hypothetical protein
VIGVFFSSKYVTNDGTPATVDDVVRHFVHIAEVGGVETVALGTDYGGITTGVPRGLESVDALPGLFERLGKAGFSEQDLALVSHGNAQRVLLHMINNMTKSRLIRQSDIGRHGTGGYHTALQLHREAYSAKHDQEHLPILINNTPRYRTGTQAFSTEGKTLCLYGQGKPGA